MAKTDTPTARAPRGTKPVSQAFFTALEQIAEPLRAAVGKAALTAIRDEMKMRRDKMKVAAAKEKEKARTPSLAAKAKPAAKPATAKPAAKAAAPAKPAAAPAPTPAPALPAATAAPAKTNGTAHQDAPAKRRGRKPANAPTTV